ncbi:hypothetical protein EV356DRAFT_580435 [Viridothelium virens]|uniref:Mid2 domain-containing protein n=1 Tax=Viridothelium virens TaxID=1048519 RepID=A0A6A6GWA8_VIRVR|nr:hypothetical protein EV356DRAFT_580435 [Viridothelium virens]
MFTHFLVVAILILQVRTLCYFPDGQTIASDNFPCLASGNSTCCEHGYACLSNKLCEFTSFVPLAPYEAHQQYVRGSCTDPSFNDPNCPTFCVDTSSGDTLSGVVGLKKCPGTTFDEYECIDRNTSVIQSHESCLQEYVIAFSGVPSTLTVIGITSTKSSSFITSWITQISSPVSEQTSSTVSGTNQSSQSVTTSSSSTPSSRTSDARPHSIALGAGIGVPLGLLALALGVLMGWKFSRSYRRNTSFSAPQQIPLQAVGYHIEGSKVMSELATNEIAELPVQTEDRPELYGRE